MRFYTERCKRTGKVPSDRVKVVDGEAVIRPFALDERDAEYVCAALNAADRQDRMSTL